MSNLMSINQRRQSDATSSFKTASDMAERRKQAEEQMDLQDKMGKTSNMMTGAGVGAMAGMGSAAMGAKFGMMAGPIGAGAGLAIGYLVSELF